MGIDPRAGLNSTFLLPEGLRDYLYDYGISHLNQARNLDPNSNHQSYWLSATDLDLDGIWVVQWTDYVKGLAHGGIILQETEDTLLWMHNKVSISISASLAYDLIVSSLLPPSLVRLHSRLSYCNVPLKIKCFVWLCIENHINTWDNLSKKGWSGPNRCSLCRTADESVNHLFVECSFARATINFLNRSHNCFLAWDDPTYWEILKTGLNTRVELLSPWALMYFSKEITIPTLHVYGDSSVIINWVNGKATLSALDLDAWCLNAIKLKAYFHKLDF